MKRKRKEKNQYEWKTNFFLLLSFSRSGPSSLSGIVFFFCSHETESSLVQHNSMESNRPTKAARRRKEEENVIMLSYIISSQIIIISERWWSRALLWCVQCKRHEHIIHRRPSTSRNQHTEQRRAELSKQRKEMWYWRAILSDSLVERKVEGFQIFMWQPDDAGPTIRCGPGRSGREKEWNLWPKWRSFMSFSSSRLWAVIFHPLLPIA